MDRHTLGAEELSETLLNIFMIQLPADLDSLTFTGTLIDHVQDPENTPIMSTLLDKVVAPHMSWKLGPQTQAGTII